MTADKPTLGPRTTAEEVLRDIDLSDKTALVTGANTGIGIETARALAMKGAHVIVTTRSREKGEATVASIKVAVGEKCGRVEYEVLELGSFASIRRCAERLLQRGIAIDYIVANAGSACVDPLQKTEDGFESTFAVNHLGHFLFLNMISSLVPKGGRIVILTSVASRFSPVLFDDINFDRTPYSKVLAYGQSKTANSLYAVALNKRLTSRGVEVFAVHPGEIKETELSRNATAEDKAVFADWNIPWKTLSEGAATSVWAVVAPELAGKGGAFLADCSIWPVNDSDEMYAVGYKSYAVDPVLAERLWAVSEEMVGEKFNF